MKFALIVLSFVLSSSLSFARETPQPQIALEDTVKTTYIAFAINVLMKSASEVKVFVTYKTAYSQILAMQFAVLDCESRTGKVCQPIGVAFKLKACQYMSIAPQGGSIHFFQGPNSLETAFLCNEAFGSKSCFVTFGGCLK